MKNKLVIFLCFLFLTFPMRMLSQAVQIQFDKKVIVTDSLHMPQNTKAITMLTMMPEMLQRQGETFLSNYDVQVDGMSVSKSYDVALNQLMIDDIVCIEIRESPISSYLNNGVGGSINLVLRSSAKEKKNYWGSASMNVAYPTELGPQLVVGTKGKKYILKTVILSDFYKNSSIEESLSYDQQDSFLRSSRQDKDHRLSTQLACASLSYNLTPHDNLSLQVSESYNALKDKTVADFQTTKANTSNSSSLGLSATLGYSHKFERSSLSGRIYMSYNPGYTESMVPTTQKWRNDYINKNLSGTMEYNQNLLPMKSSSTLNLGMGCTINKAVNNSEIIRSLMAYQSDLQINPQNNTMYFQPYLYLIAKTGNFSLKLSGEFQHYKYDIERMDKSFSTHADDFTGKFITEWHILPKQTLRFIADRKLVRPTENQLFPLLNYSVENLSYLQGNPNLKTVLSHEFTLNYLTYTSWEDHSLTFDARASYNNVNRLINMVNEDGSSSTDGYIGQMLKYKTFVNNGHQNILNSSLMAIYAHKGFIVSLTGNVYNKHQHVASVKSNYTYYNVAIHPEFTLKDGWSGGIYFVYSSKVKLSEGTLSDYATSYMNIGKRWDKLFVYFYNQVGLQKQAVDKTVTSNGVTYRNYEMSPNMVGMGMNYTF